MLQRDAEEAEPGLSRTASLRFAHDFSRVSIHPPAAAAKRTKLTVSQPADEYRQEADSISDQVIRVAERQFQRACTCGAACPKCQTEQVEQEDEPSQTARLGSGDSEQNEVPPIVCEVLRSPGQPIDPATRVFLEPRFNSDFSHVRVHADTAASASATAVNARAYTVGHNIVFGAGQYAPATAEGKRLIAHELAHVVQQGEDATVVPQHLTIAPTGDQYEQEADRAAEAVSRADAPAVGAVADRALKPLSRLKLNLSLQRQPCKKEDDTIVTGPLPTQLPNIKCEPRPETLAAVRAVPGVPPTILGVTASVAGGQKIEFQELRASKCKATILSDDTLTFGNFLYTKAGIYDNGTEVTPPGRACPQGKTIATRLRVTEPMAQKLRLGEIEHCEDKKLAFALSMGKYNQAIRDLAGEYCPGGPPSPQGPECRKEFGKRFQDRTGVAFDTRQQVSDCLLNKSQLRDDNHWHDIIPADWAYAPDCSSVTYIANPDVVPDIGTHPPSEIVQGCGEK